MSAAAQDLIFALAPLAAGERGRAGPPGAGQPPGLTLARGCPYLP